MVLSLPLIYAVDPFAAVLLGVGSLVVLYAVYGHLASTRGRESPASNIDITTKMFILLGPPYLFEGLFKGCRCTIAEAVDEVAPENV